jgi:DnaK suppressor protein
MAVKSKAPAKKTPVKKAAKTAARPAAKTKHAVKPSAKPAAKPAPAKAAPVKAAPVRTAAKPTPKDSGKAIAKAPPLPAGKALAKVAPGARPAPKPTPAPMPAANLPPPRPPAPKPATTVSPKEFAAATEYLLTRSASRSEAPVIVNGKRLPTEEELLKMPESDYMNESQLAFFKHRLQQIERELLANADETTEHLRETVIVPDPADRATIEEEHALELRTRDRERKLLKKIQSSLASIESGDYGYCEETGDPIGIPRLLARPTATLSLEAQQRRELKQKMFGD